MKCTLCGYEFDQQKAINSCGNCPTAKGCKLIRCPNCGFETPPEPGWIKNLRKKEESKMTKLSVNQEGKVMNIATDDLRKLQKIMAMGIFPGATVKLIQKFPSFVFQVGQSQFAVDKELASCVHLSVFQRVM